YLRQIDLRSLADVDVDDAVEPERHRGVEVRVGRVDRRLGDDDAGELVGGALEAVDDEVAAHSPLLDAHHVEARGVDGGAIEDLEAVRLHRERALHGGGIEVPLEVVEAAFVQRPCDVRLGVRAQIAEQGGHLDVLEGDGAGGDGHAIREGRDGQGGDGHLAVRPVGDQVGGSHRAAPHRDVEVDPLAEDLAVDAHHLG